MLGLKSASPEAAETDAPATIDLGTDDIVGDGEGFEIVLGEPIDPPAPNRVTESLREIDLILAEFKGRRPALAAAEDGLAVRVSSLLLDLGHAVRADRVRVVSVGGLRGIASLLPEGTSAHAAAALGKAFADAVSPAVVKTLGDALDETFSPATDEILGEEACRDLSEIVWTQVTCGCLEERGELADGLAEIAWKALHHALRFQIGFALAEMPAHRDTAVGILALFAQGNFPLGFMADGTFLVLTA